MPDIGQGGGGHSDEQDRHGSCPRGAHRWPRKMETKELHRMRTDGERTTWRSTGALRGRMTGRPYTG